MGSETELKFRVFEKDPGEIIDAILKDSEIISKETHKLTNEYYDTEDLQLMRSHSGFRVRSTDGVYEETVKTSASSGEGSRRERSSTYRLRIRGRISPSSRLRRSPLRRRTLRRCQRALRSSSRATWSAPPGS